MTRPTPRIPARITYMHIPYTIAVEAMESEEDRGRFGYVDHAANHIGLNACMETNVMWITLLHELVHVMLTHAGRRKQNEAEIELIAHGLWELFHNNPGLAEALRDA